MPKRTMSTQRIAPSKFLVPREEYLASGIHIGMKQRTKHMKPFIYKIRPDSLAVMNLQIIDERIRIAAKFLARAKKLLVISRKSVAHDAVSKFSEIVGAHNVKGRFMPGMLTNPHYERFYEADMVLIVDPLADYQAMKEATTARIPVIGICDTFNETNNIDLIIPANNKGVRSIALLFWLLAREVLKEQGKIKNDEEFKYKVEDFAKEDVFKPQPRRREYERRQTGRPTTRSTRRSTKSTARSK